MPVMSTHKQSDMEKRLKLLNMQLYGKEIESKNSLPKTINYEPKTNNNISDVTFLKHDLKKIALLTSLAIGTELILYFSKLLDKIKLF